MSVSVAEILEQVKKLSLADREAVAKGVKELLVLPQAPSVEFTVEAPEQETHWGKNLLRLLDELGPIELAHPEIEDPVEWVATMRREERERRLGEFANWDEGFDAGEDAT